MNQATVVPITALNNDTHTH